MATIGEYGQIHRFCMYCDTLVCKSSNFGQVCTIESLTNAVQSSVSLSLKETISQKLEMTCSSSSNVVSHTDEFDSPMASPTHQSWSRLSDTFNSTFEVSNSYINEEKERSRRRLNVIVHNVAELSAESGSERKSHDISNVASIFDKYVGVKVKVTNANRIGRRKDDQPRPRLIKVSVESERDKAMLLRNCTKLHARDNLEDIQKVYITPDLTPREQQHNKELRIQLAEKNKSGKKYFIKNGGIVQMGGLKPSLCTHSMHHTPSSTALNCFLTNAQSISNKLSELRALVTHSDYHVIGIQGFYGILQ